MGSRMTRLENEALRLKKSSEEILERQNKVNQMLKQFLEQRKQMNREQLQKFNSFQNERIYLENNRKQNAMLEEKSRANEAKLLHKTVDTLLKEFHENHTEMSKSLWKELQAMEQTRKAEAIDYNKELRDNLLNLQNETYNLLNVFHLAHKDMRKHLKQSLNDYTVQRLKQARYEKQERIQFIYDFLDLDLGITKPKAPPQSKPESSPEKEPKNI